MVDTSTFVAEILRARGRKLLAHPDRELVVAAEAVSETEHELRPFPMLDARHAD